MKHLIIYVHGKGGNADEAEHYKSLFPESDVIGFDYKSQNPWEAKKEFPAFFDLHAKNHSSVILIANSLGAFFSISSLETISNFASKTGAKLTVMKNGEHWFHTKEQMDFLDEWIKSSCR